jgi:bacillithiol synthase
MFKTHTLGYDVLPNIAARDRDFLLQNADLQPFIPYSSDWKGFEDALAVRKAQQQTAAERISLQRIIQAQYTENEAIMSAETTQNLDKLLLQNSFTLVTAHQPNLLLGPLYYIYKILSVVKMTQEANKRYADAHFIPVFWIGSEDHDLEELNFFNAYNKKLVWQTEQTGAVGRMSITDLQPLLTDFYTVLGESPNAVFLKNILENAFDFTKNKTLAQSTFYLINTLFAKYGLVVINQDDAALKAVFQPYMQRELLDRATENLVLQDIAEMEKAGFKGQAMPRNINLFYHTPDKQRSRIVFENNTYSVLNSNISFTEMEILEKLKQNPENFSPNVVLRPVFQEAVLPNIAYIGGGGELAYWQERRRVFAYFKLPFPQLIRRQSALVLTAALQKRMEKVGFLFADFWKTENELVKLYLDKNSEGEINIEKEKQDFNTLFATILAKATAIDTALDKTVQAEQQKILNALEQLEQKIVRAEKRKHEVALQQIQNIKEKLFPERGLQERFDNFSPYFVQYGDGFFDALLQSFQPFFQEFLVFEEMP